MSDVDQKEGWINSRPLVLEKPGQDYAIAFSNNRQDFINFIQTYKNKPLLDLACGKGVAVRDMRAMGIDALGLDARPSDNEYLIQGTIEKSESNPRLKGKKFPLVISVQGFGVYSSSRSSPEGQIKRQFQSIAGLMEKDGSLIFTTTGGSENRYSDYYGKPVPEDTLFEIRYTDNPTPELSDQDKSRVPLLKIARESGFEHIWDNNELPFVDQKQVVKLRYVGK